MSRADIQERARLLDQIDRLNALFGSRFHLDAQCGSCGGPLECDRDAICHRCTDAMKIERLQTEVDALRRWAKTAKNAFHDAMECLHYEKHEGLPAHKALHPDDWERLKNWLGELKSAREAAEKARAI